MALVSKIPFLVPGIGHFVEPPLVLCRGGIGFKWAISLALVSGFGGIFFVSSSGKVFLMLVCMPEAFFMGTTCALGKSS